MGLRISDDWYGVKSLKIDFIYVHVFFVIDNFSSLCSNI